MGGGTLLLSGGPGNRSVPGSIGTEQQPIPIPAHWTSAVFLAKSVTSFKFKMRVNLNIRTVARLMLWLLLNAPAGVHAQFAYTTTNGTITITGYIGTNDDVVNPSTIDGLQVTGIGTHAFQQAPINTVSIPNTVITISGGAFSQCTSLTNVALGNGVTGIGEGSTSPLSPEWQPLQTNAINNGVVNFIDPNWPSYPSRFYRVRSQ